MSEELVQPESAGGIDAGAGSRAANGERGPSRDFMERIGHDFARRHLVLSGGVVGGVERLRCAASTPVSVLHNLGVRLGRGVQESVEEAEWLARQIDEAYGRARRAGGEPPTGGLVCGSGEGADLRRDVEALMAAADQDLLATAGKGPVVRFVDGMLFEALGRRASDVHVQPLADRTLVRYRIDGVLHTAHTLPRAATLAVVSRVKVMGRMDIAERRVPQDGRATVTIGREERPDGGEARAIDLRLSTLPTSYGERLVIRLLDTRHTRSLGTFGALGMPEGVRRGFLGCASRSSGIVLVTGPTGSGKTTTLYTTLHRIARAVEGGVGERGEAEGERGGAGGLNVMTIEDPIEYELSTAGVAVSQAQVNSRKGVTFARGLRHILRQDPDVVMVGEIRDEETARVAIQASLTGHLVLSTLHTNDAASAVTRLVDLGVEAYLVGASLSCVLAQRLVRRLHGDCGGAGCAACFATGFEGRIGVFELLVVDERLRPMIAARATSGQIREAARGRGMRTLRDAGMDLVSSGITTRVEVERVAHMLDDEALEVPPPDATGGMSRRGVEPVGGGVLP